MTRAELESRYWQFAEISSQEIGGLLSYISDADLESIVRSHEESDAAEAEEASEALIAGLTP